jgi:hypothetical protein
MENETHTTPRRACRQRILHVFALLFWSVSAFGSQTTSSLRLEPHRYFGKRGNEPAQQLIIQGKLDWFDAQTDYPWRLTLHGDFETLGRKDNSVDIDRAWIEVPLSGPTLFVGRIHPYDISRSFEATRPWGLLAQSQAQNRSILLGSPFSDGPYPSPILQGWIGAHVWSDATHLKTFQYGFSATPVFIPSMGSSVNFDAPIASRVGRFGRQPPGYVELHGRRFPVNYKLDTSEVVSEILQPQLMGQTYVHGNSEKAHWESWMAVSRAPSIDPELDTKGQLDLRGERIEAIAQVKPHFLQKWSASMSNRVSARANKDYSLFSTVQWTQGGAIGAEVGANAPYIGVSYLNRFSTRASLFDSASYTDHLVQFEGRVPISNLTAYGGAKYHIFNQGSWIRAGVRTQVNSALGLDMGMDLFTGRNGSYFSEWRTNDRLYVGLNWKLGS